MSKLGRNARDVEAVLDDNEASKISRFGARVSYDFFFSYPRMEWNAYLEKFYNDLHKAVKRLRGGDVDRAFRDRDDIERGLEWDVSLRNALQASSTIVAIYCPTYFMRDVCLKELRVMEQRRQIFLAQTAGGTTLPSPIKPVSWIAPFEAPPDLATLQYGTEADEFFRDKGLDSFMRVSSTRSGKYPRFIDTLARDIVATAKQVNLPSIADFPSFMDDDTSAVQTPPSHEEGPTHVKFVYLAATEHAAEVRDRKGYYGPWSRSWKPFLPKSPQGIGPLAQAVAGEYDFTSDELSFSSALPRAVRDAEDRKNVVVILMDGWAVRMPSYAAVLAELDRVRALNCGVLVPWSSGDAKTAGAREALAHDIRRALYRWASEPNPARFNDAINDAEEFRVRLAEALTRLKNDILMASEPRISGPAKPTISNTLG